MPKHIHTDLMMQYAQDAQESETPWKNWEYQSACGKAWSNLTGVPTWVTHYKYRRKPKTVIINGFTVNAPVDKEPVHGDLYYYPDVVLDEFHCYTAYEAAWDKKNYERGVCFSNKEDAIAMAKAMLRIDPSK